MAENVPPGSAPANASADQPGRPYYESLRSNLRTTLEKKRLLDAQLAKIEDDIHKAEGAYLEETSSSGNIVRGFDGWVKGVNIGAGGRNGDDRRRGRIREEDRVFSRSSVGWMKVRLMCMASSIHKTNTNSRQSPKSRTPAHLLTRPRQREALRRSSREAIPQALHLAQRLSRFRTTRRSGQRTRTMTRMPSLSREARLRISGIDV